MAPSAAEQRFRFEMGELDRESIRLILKELQLSKAPLYLTVERENSQGEKLKLTEPVIIKQVDREQFEIDLSDSTLSIITPAQVEIVFGYNRKRASFLGMIENLENSVAKIEIPSSLQFSDRRRNPRMQVSKQPAGISLDVRTAKGLLQVKGIRAVEISTLGLKLVLDTPQDSLHSGDKIESLVLQDSENLILETSGVISRVASNKKADAGSDQCEITLLFRSPKEVLPTLNFADASNMDLKFETEHPLLSGEFLKGSIFSTCELESGTYFRAKTEKTALPIAGGIFLHDAKFTNSSGNATSCGMKILHVGFNFDGTSSIFELTGRLLGKISS